MSDGEISFDYTGHDKLDMAVFPTIRRDGDHGEIGDVLTVVGGEDTLGHVEVIAKETTTLEEINPKFFQFDTGGFTWQEGYVKLSHCYDDPIGPDEELVIYWLKWTVDDGDDGDGPVVEITEGNMASEHTLYLTTGESHKHRDSSASFCEVEVLE